MTVRSSRGWMDRDPNRRTHGNTTVRPRRKEHDDGERPSHRAACGPQAPRAAERTATEAQAGGAPHDSPSARRQARQPATACRARSTPRGSPRPIGMIRSSSWRSRPPPGCRSWCRSATGGCWCHRSRSSAGPRLTWPRTWPAAPGPASTSSSAATHTCPTSAPSPRPIGASSSASTTSTRRCLDHSSGTSNASRPASPSRAATGPSTRRRGRRSTPPQRGPTGRRCTSSRGWATSRSGMPASRSRISSEPCGRAAGSRSSGSSTTWPRRSRRTA